VIDIEDAEFFDTLYQGWSKTYGAETMFWMPEKVEIGNDEMWEIYAVDEQQEKHFIGTLQGEDDAAWITALHGCFADLTRRLHQALDEAERFEIEKDQVISEMLEVALENNELREQLEGYRQRYG